MRLCVSLVAVVALSVSALAENVPRRRAVLPPTSPPTSETLIASALASGQIDAETALEYRVYAAFADCRLPAKFRGDDSAVTNSMVAAEVAVQFDTLSAPTQAALLPFLRPPYAANGWVQQQADACGWSKQSTAFASDFVSALGGKVTVTYRTDVAGDAKKARDIAAEIEARIWPNLTDLMGREPLPYFGETRRWDLSLVFINDSRPGHNVDGTTQSLETAPGHFGCKQTPAFSEVDSRAPNIFSAVAHELMHAILFSYDVTTPCQFPEYHWWHEASATWAEDRVYKEVNSEHLQAPHFLNAPEVSLECMGVNCPGHQFGAYLLPFYIGGRHFDDLLVRRSWEAAQTRLSLDAIDSALTPYGGFETVWPEFVVANWNRFPVNDYMLDKLNIGASAEETNVLLGGSDRVAEMESNGVFAGPLSIEPLSAQYFDFKFSDPKVRSVVFINGLTFKLAIRPHPMDPKFGDMYVLDNADREKTLGARVQALMKINGEWENKARDLTDVDSKEFCREVVAERIDELLIIFSNSQYKRREPVMRQGVKPPTLFASNMECYGWKTVKMTVDSTVPNLPLRVSFTAKFHRIASPSAKKLTKHGLALPSEGEAVSGVGYTGSGEVAWSMNGNCGDGCTCSGSDTVPLDIVVLTTWNFVPRGGKLYRGYDFGLLAQKQMTYQQTCPGPALPPSSAPVPPLATETYLDANQIADDGVSTKPNPKVKNLETIAKIDWKLVSDPP